MEFAVWECRLPQQSLNARGSGRGVLGGVLHVPPDDGRQGRNQDLNLAKRKCEILTGHRNRCYSRVHIRSDTAFLKIVKKPSIVQE